MAFFGLKAEKIRRCPAILYGFAVDIFPRGSYTWDKNLKETESHHEEHVLFCILLLYYARIVRLICDAKMQRRL